MRKIFAKIDWLTFLPVFLLTLMGLITIISFNLNNITIVSQSLIIKHIISIILGIILSIIIAQIDYRVLSSLIRALFFSIISVLILVLIFGDKINGARSWFSIGFLNLQPAEFAKIIVVIIVAHYFSRYHHKLNSFIYIIMSLIPVIVIVFFVLLQPDFGTASILLLLWLGMVILGGVKVKHIMILIGSGLLITLFLWFFIFKDYQKQRILTFFNPTADPLGSGYNVLQSIKSVGSGGFMGIKEQLVAVPEIHTDFIFSGFSQQWGFLGVSIYFIIISIILGRIIYIGFKNQDVFSSMITLGVALCILIQLTINIGMNIGLLPVTGVPLPFMSYGGSSMLVYWILIGLVLSIQNHKMSTGTIFMKDNQDIFG